MKKKYTEVWNCERGYLVPKTNELETEVMKIRKLWEESEALEGYCPHAREAKVCEYKHPYYEVWTVAEHTGVTFVGLWRIDLV